VLITTRVQLRDLAGTATAQVVTRDSISRPLTITTTYTSVTVTETITRDPTSGLATSKARTVTNT
jgi:hypothetical protein